MERIEFDNHWISLASYSLVHVTCLSKKMAITESGIVYYRSNDVRHLLFLQSNLVNCRMNERICVVVHIKALYSFWHILKKIKNKFDIKFRKIKDSDLYIHSTDNFYDPYGTSMFTVWLFFVSFWRTKAKLIQRAIKFIFN